jgi:hypothetical protein
LLLLEDAGIAHDFFRTFGDHTDANAPHHGVKRAE